MIAPHQQAFADTARPYEGLFWGTGCAKTRAALYAVRECNGSILIIAPKTSVQKKQWEYEAYVLGLTAPDVVSYEMFRRDWRTLKKYKAIIADEAHKAFGVEARMIRKNKQWVPKTSLIFEYLLAYLEQTKPRYFIPATATPNKTAMSIWAAATLLGHHWDYKAFREEFYYRLPTHIYTQCRGKEYRKKLAERTAQIGQILRLEDIKEVPPQTFMTVSIIPTAEQTTMLKTLPSRFTDQSALRSKRHQVENGVLYEDTYSPSTHKVSKEITRIDSAKIDYILERAIEFPKMVIFATYTEQVYAIAEALKKNTTGEVYCFTGATKNRKEIETNAEAAESAYIVAQASISSEWELKSCPIMIFASLSNRAIDYIQAQGRIQRYDAVKKNLYIHLVTTYKRSIDERWFDTIMNGRDFNEALYETQ